MPRMWCSIAVGEKAGGTLREVPTEATADVLPGIEKTGAGESTVKLSGPPINIGPNGPDSGSTAKWVQEPDFG